eukprot:493921_1
MHHITNQQYVVSNGNIIPPTCNPHIQRALQSNANLPTYILLPQIISPISHQLLTSQYTSTNHSIINFQTIQNINPATNRNTITNFTIKNHKNTKPTINKINNHFKTPHIIETIKKKKINSKNVM